jgi:hypothetical protein
MNRQNVFFFFYSLLLFFVIQITFSASLGFERSQTYLDSLEESSIPVGRLYYQSLLDNEVECHWAVPIDFHYEFATKGFNSCGQSTDLAQEIFNGWIILQDIYLFSKLSAANLINIDGVPRQPGRPDVPPFSLLPFGSYASDLYTTLLANLVFNLDAKFTELVGDVSVIYNFANDSKKMNGALGIIVPIQSRTHTLDFSFFTSDCTGLIKGPPVETPFTKWDSLKDFFTNFSSLQDFFVREVLAPKNICFEKIQQKNGIGDISLFGLIDVGNYFACLESWQLGANLVFPTGGKESGTKVWQPVLGNGGAFQFEFYSQVLFRTKTNFFNPTVRLMGQVSAPFKSCRRVPRCVSVDVEKIDDVSQTVVDDLVIHPVLFYNYHIIDDFSFFDSCVKGFSDHLTETRTRYGPRVICSVGNYFYNAFNLGFRLGIFYDYMHKGSDSVRVKCADGIYNTCVLEQNTNENMHTFGWNLTYKFTNMIELNIGSQNVFAGTNVAQINDFYASLILVF